MKTILLATDFSAGAHQAANFASQLANDQKATLVLLHAWQFWPDNPAKTGDFPLSATATRADSEAKLAQLAHELTKVFGMYTPIRCLAREGHARDVIRKVAMEEDADLLVMATVGTAPQTTRLMGSLATEMVTSTTLPMLLIPPVASYEGLKNTMLGIDLAHPPGVVAFDKVMAFARIFGSTLNVLCVSAKLDDPKTHEQAAKLRELLSRQPFTLTIQAEDDDLQDTLLAFAHSIQADLIMLLPQPHNWLMNLLVEGETQRMARLTNVPLLAIV
ncbi:universal stress protein [Fibrella aquatilis]|uniref:Universal stress protein n=1 Tax=Fibrella aquatilis TaxID=2817059 RepID=A0A939G1T2_9BACT|nr:universal stress protein [Fibrella aquatilis]MBO0930301.1 universal stress protein [Fibrella aquatilis]